MVFVFSSPKCSNKFSSRLTMQNDECRTAQVHLWKEKRRHYLIIGLNEYLCACLLNWGEGKLHVIRFPWSNRSIGENDVDKPQLLKAAFRLQQLPPVLLTCPVKGGGAVALQNVEIEIDWCKKDQKGPIQSCSCNFSGSGMFNPKGPNNEPLYHFLLFRDEAT